MQWKIDALTVSFVVLVVALASLVPFPVGASLHALEAAFGFAFVPLRHRQLCGKHSGGPAGEASLSADESDIEEDIYSASSRQASWLSSGLGALRALLDPSEPEAELVRRDGGRWFEGHLEGGVRASDLGLNNVVDFLSYSRECVTVSLGIQVPCTSTGMSRCMPLCQ